MVFTDSGVTQWSAFEMSLAELGVSLCSDNIHDVKNLINGVRSTDIRLRGMDVNIEKDLWPLFPVDHMDIRPIKVLFELVPFLIPYTQNNPKLYCLVEYLNGVKIWYEVWNDNEEYLNKPFHEKISLLQQVSQYFMTLGASSKRDIMAFSRAPKSFQAVVKWFNKIPWDGRLGWFGSNIVENLGTGLSCLGQSLCRTGQKKLH